MSYPTCYHSDTPEKVKNIIESEMHTNNRIRVFYGDTDTGLDWGEENCTIGYIGKSTGTKPIPLMINNSRSSGGPSLLDHCIIKITKNGRTLYQHENYHTEAYTVAPSDLPDYCESVYVDNEVQARFKNPGQATRYVDFMLGKRNSK